MAAEKLSWVFELFDQMSGPAMRISKSLGTVHSSVGKTQTSLGLLDNKLWGFDTTAFTVVDGFKAVSGAIAAAGAAFVGLSYAIGKSALSSFAFKESTLATMRALYGSADAADAMFKKAVDIAKLTPFGVEAVAGGFAKLSAAGFKQEEVPVVFQGVSDIASFSGRGAEAIGSLTLAMSQIMGKGHLAAQELNQITEAAGGAVSATKLFEKVSQLKGARVGYAEMEAGIIDARSAMMGLMMVAKDLGGGVIGQTSIDQSKTLGGLWSNLQDSFTNMWLTMDLSSSGWFKTVKSFLSNLIDALDTSSAAGRELQAVFDRLFGRFASRFLGEFAGPAGLGSLQNGIVGLAKAFEHFMDLGLAGFEGLWTGLRAGLGPLIDLFGTMDEGNNDVEAMRGTMMALGQGIGAIVTGFAMIGTAVSSAFTFAISVGDKLIDVFNGITNAIEGLIKMVGGGLVTGLSLGFVDATSTAEEGADRLINGFKQILGIRSPSSVFEELGAQTLAGYEKGLEGGLPGMSATLGEEVLASGAVGGGFTAAGGVNVNLTLNLDNTGHLDGDSIAQRLQEVLPSTLANVFDQLAAERGLST